MPSNACPTLAMEFVIEAEFSLELRGKKPFYKAVFIKNRLNGVKY